MPAPVRPVSPAAVIAAVLLLVATPAASLAATAADGDPLRRRQWHLNAVSVARAWEAGRGEDVTVAVIDTGVDLDHPDLAGRIRSGYDATDPGSPPDDENGHGTLVAGVVAAAAGNGEGGAGVAPEASILPVRVLDEEGRGRPSEIADGIRWAAEHGADVLNLSFVEIPGASEGLLGGLIDERVERAIREAHEAGAVIVSAAGNGGRDEVPYTEDLPLTVVGASNRDGTRWQRSNAGPDTVFAPGVDVVSTWTRGRYAQASGTSFATPIVAGGAAILLQAGVAPGRVARVLRQQARRVGTAPPGVEVVDLGAAVAAGAPAAAGAGDGQAAGGGARTSEAASGGAPEPAGVDGTGGEDRDRAGGGSGEPGQRDGPGASGDGAGGEPAPDGGPDDDGPGADPTEPRQGGASGQEPPGPATADRPADAGAGDAPGADGSGSDAGGADPSDGAAPLHAPSPEVVAPSASPGTSSGGAAGRDASEGREVASRGGPAGEDASGPAAVPLVAAWVLLAAVIAGHAGWWAWRRRWGG